MNRVLKGRVVVLGAGGMLGHDVIASLKHVVSTNDILEFAHSRLDVTDRAAVQAMIHELRPSFVMNCAAYTDVDGCEKNVELANRVNALAPGGLGESCRSTGAILVHYSTDFVFDGKSRAPYLESDATNPLSAYGKSKLEGERMIIASGCRYLMIRTSWLFGVHGRNFVEAIAGKAQRGEPLRVVCDQVGRPTFASDLAEATLHLLSAGAEGIVHFANSGECSWHEFAGEIVRLSGYDRKVESIQSHELNRPARRPAYSVLNLEKYQALSRSTPRHWKDALTAYLQARNEKAATHDALSTT